MKNLKRELNEGRVLLGTACRAESPTIAELFAIIGFDFIFIDCEHGPMGYETVRGMIQAVNAGGAATIVRPAETSRSNILQAFEAGANGIILPQVNNMVDAATGVAFSRYPPLGARGVGAPRNSKFGIEFNDYYKRATDDELVMALIESPEAVDNLEGILSVKGLDLVFIGYTDLSTSLGHPGEMNHPKVKEASDTILKILADEDFPFGISVRNVGSIEKWIELGAKMLMVGGDLVYLAEKGQADIKAAREMGIWRS